MNKISFLFLVLATVNSAFGQMEKPDYKNTSAQFLTYYNEGKTDSIFALFSPDMQNALPADQTTAFIKGLKAEAGQINNMVFIKHRSGYASYKATFEKGLFAVDISLDGDTKINGLMVSPYKESIKPKLERNKTLLNLPFKDQWTVTWGGDTKELNYHVESEAQKNAFDFVITDSTGKTFKTHGKTNEDYYAFGKELVAPCDGEVVLAVDGIKDNLPGVTNPIYIPGNTVIIKTANNEYLFFAHFKQNSIQVKEGQKVKKGQLLGLCGNSGNSSEPHLHFHIQNIEDMNDATGVKCHFEQLKVNGQVKTDYSPVKNDKIKLN